MVDGAARLKRFMATKWEELVLSIMVSALAPQHLEDVLWNVEEVDAVLLATRCGSSQVFPWRFFLVLDSDERLAQETLEEMKKEWQFLVSQEEKMMEASRFFPLSEIPFVRWRVYREVMTFCEERGWKLCHDVKALIESWQAWPQAAQSGCEEAFRHLRLAERKHDGEAAPAQLQALSIKGLQQRYDAFELAPVNPSQIHAIPVKQTVKSAAFTAKRASGSDTGLPSFGALLKESTISPHNLTRRSINLWKMLKLKDGDLSLAWVAELIRTGQVWQWFESF